MNGVSITNVFVTKFSETDPYVPFGYRLSIEDSTSKLTGVKSGDYDAYTLGILNQQYNLGLNFAIISRELSIGIFNYLDIMAKTENGQAMPFVENCLLKGNMNCVIPQEYNQLAANTFQSIVNMFIPAYVNNPSVGKISIPFGYYDSLYAYYSMPTQNSTQQIPAVQTVSKQTVEKEETKAQPVEQPSASDSAPDASKEIPKAAVFGEDHNTSTAEDTSNSDEPETYADTTDSQDDSETSNIHMTPHDGSVMSASDGNLRSIFPNLYKMYDEKSARIKELSKKSPDSVILDSNTTILDYFLGKLIKMYGFEFVDAGSDVLESMDSRISSATYIYNLQLISRRLAKIGCYSYEYEKYGSRDFTDEEGTVHAYKDTECSNINPNNFGNSNYQAVYNSIVERLAPSSDTESIIAIFNWVCSLEVTNKSTIWAFLRDILNHPLKTEQIGSSYFAGKMDYVTALQALRRVITDIDTFMSIPIFKDRINLYISTLNEDTLTNTTLAERIVNAVSGANDDKDIKELMDKAFADYIKRVEVEFVKYGYLVSVLGPISEAPVTFSDDSDDYGDSDSSDENIDPSASVGTPLYLKENGALVDYVINDVIDYVARTNHQTLTEALCGLLKNGTACEDAPRILFGTKVSEMIGLPTLCMVFSGSSIIFTCTLNGNTTFLDPVVLARQVYNATTAFSITNSECKPNDYDPPLIRMMYETITDPAVLGRRKGLEAEYWSDNLNKPKGVFGKLPIKDQNIYGKQNWDDYCSPDKAQSWLRMNENFFRFVTQPQYFAWYLNSERPDLKVSNNTNNYITVEDIENIIENGDNEGVKAAAEKVKAGLEVFFEYVRDSFVSSPSAADLNYNTYMEELRQRSEYTDDGLRDQEASIAASMIFYELYRQDMVERTGKDPFTSDIDLYQGSSRYYFEKPVLVGVKTGQVDTNGEPIYDIRLIGAIVTSSSDKKMFMPLASERFMDYLLSNGSILDLGDLITKFVKALRSGDVVPNASKWDENDETMAYYHDLCVGVKNPYATLVQKVFGLTTEQKIMFNETKDIASRKELMKRFISKNTYLMALLDCPIFNDGKGDSIADSPVFDHSGNGYCIMNTTYSKKLVNLFDYMYAWTGMKDFMPIVIRMSTEYDEDPTKRIVDVMAAELNKETKDKVYTAESLAVIFEFVNRFRSSQSIDPEPYIMEKWVTKKFEDDISESYREFLSEQ